MDQQPPRTIDAPAAVPTQIKTIKLLDNNDEVTDSMMALNASNGHDMIKPTIMEGITPGVIREINLDSNEVSKCKELNGNERNTKLKAEGFINVPIAYVGNMVNSGKNFQCEP